MPEENMHYTCIACITIDSAMRMEKKNHPPVYLEQCKYKIKKTQTSTCINTELDSDSDSESNAELMAKLKSDSDNDSGYDTIHWLQILMIFLFAWMIIYSHRLLFYLHGWFFVIIRFMFIYWCKEVFLLTLLV